MGTWGRGHKTGACSSAASSLDIASPAEDKLGGGSMPGEDVAPLQQVSILGTAFFFWWDQEFESGFLQGGVLCHYTDAYSAYGPSPRQRFRGDNRQRQSLGLHRFRATAR